MMKLLDFVRNHWQLCVRFTTCSVLILLGFIVYGFTSCTYQVTVSENVRGTGNMAVHACSPDEVLRLHVVAAGDEVLDQRVKIEDRDSVIREASEIFNGVKDVRTAIRVCEENLNLFEDVATRTLERLGYMAGVKASVKRETFPTMGYGNVVLPCDDYIALKVEIGEARGTNWWCVLFPSLCLVDLDATQVLEKDLSVIDEGISVEITTKRNEEIVTDMIMSEVLYDMNQMGTHISQARANFELPKWVVRMLGVNK